MGKRVKKRSGGVGHTLLTIFLIGITTAAICAIAFAIYIHSYINPSLDIDIANLGMDFTSIVYYEEDGETKELQRLHAGQNRIWADMSEIPEELGKAFVAIEDKRFYSHNGVDWKRTSGAVVNWITGSQSYGGSTITQQLIKNITSDNQYSVKRKVTEILRALELEKQVDDKDKILELYMNTIYLGNSTVYGVRTAADIYFGKEITDLNLAECALIAGITNNPAKYNPFRHPENAKERQETILHAMCDQGMITEEERDSAINYELKYNTDSVVERQEPYSYFVDTVVRDVINDLIEEKGYSRQFATTLVNSGGLKIYSTVDMKVQQAMEKVYANDKNFPNISKNGTRPESAMVVLDPYTGHLVGVVGGRNVEDKNSLDFNRATQATRQPGSAIKPISVYGPAIDLGVIEPGSLYEDSPFKKINGKDWPSNESKRYTNNDMTVQTAVAKSINTVAVKVLDDITPKKSYEYLTERLGITTLVKNSDIDYATLALGGLSKGMTVREIAAAYTPFVNDGLYSSAKSYTKVVDSDGAVILDTTNDEPVVAFDNEDTAKTMTYLLENAVTNGTGRSAKISGMATAGKTGTTTSNRDRWFVGYTPYYVGATWFGYDTSYGLPNLSYNPSVRVWNKVMSEIHKGLPSKSFDTSGINKVPEPADEVEVTICEESELIASGYCPTTKKETFEDGKQPTKVCDIHTGDTEEPSEPEEPEDENQDNTDTDTGENGNNNGNNNNNSGNNNGNNNGNGNNNNGNNGGNGNTNDGSGNTVKPDPEPTPDPSLPVDPEA